MNHDATEVREVLARYVRATDARNGPALAALFTTQGRVQVFHGRDASALLLGELVGREAISHAVGALMAPHPPGGFSHHVTADAIVGFIGSRATLDAQYIVFSTLASVRPAGGWPADARGAQGTIIPIEAGYYRGELERVDGRWQFSVLRIEADFPLAIQQADPA